MQSATRWLPVALWMSAIFVASSMHGSSIPSGWAVEGHILEYSILGALVVRAAWGRLPSARATALGIVIASSYGLTDELHQVFVPGRMADPVDWAIDTLAATVGALMFAWIATRVAARGTEPQ